MKLALIIFGITVFLIVNTYYEGKYFKILKSWKKYYYMAMYAFIGLSLYLFIKKQPMTYSKDLIKHATGIIKYMPIDKQSTDLLTPMLDFSSKHFFGKENLNHGGDDSYQPGNYNAVGGGMEASREKRILNSGKKGTKRSVSETKKKYVASQQNWRCNDCNDQLKAWFEVDHVVRLEHGGSNHVDNLVALCRECHGKKTAFENF